MRRFIPFLVILFLSVNVLADVRMMVISDPHVYSTALFDSSSVFNTYKESEPKIIEHSQELFDSALVRIRAAHPDILLIPGDLTKDGERASHEYVAAQLNSLVDDGIKVIVVPGNHDIDNPSAYSYLAEQKTAVANISMAGFDSLYTRCGFADAVLRQPNDLGYMIYPADSLAIICLNSTQDNAVSRHSAGGLTEATLQWAEQAAAQARADGRYIMAMMHHQIVEHFDREAMVGPTYLANQEEGYPRLDSVQMRLVNAGITLMLTGHFHIHSIQHDTISGELYDVSTGALCAYASPIRTLVLKPGGKLKITTEHIERYYDLQKQRNVNTVNGAINTLSKSYYSRLMGKVYEELDSALVGQMNMPQTWQEMASGVREYMGTPLLNALNSLSYGDEDEHSPFMLYLQCKAAFDNYYNHIVGGVSSPKLAAAYGLVEALLNGELQSVLYNWVGDEDNTIPDGELTIRLPRNQGTNLESLPENKPLIRTGVYSLDGRYIGTSVSSLPQGAYIVDGKLTIVQ